MGMRGLKKRWRQSTLSDLIRLNLPAPDHEYGFSDGLLQSHLSPGEWKKFARWMYGQTCMLDAKLGTINYTHDVIRGLDLIRHGTPTYWD
jgi:hypothetical protein